MATTLAQLEAQIAKLERRADALRTKEIAGVIARIKVAIDYYGLTAADLGFSARSATASRKRSNGSAGSANGAATTRPPARRGAAAKKTAGVIRFRDEAGNSWTGHGKRPGWFKAAIEAGKTPADLAVSTD